MKLPRHSLQASIGAGPSLLRWAAHGLRRVPLLWMAGCAALGIGLTDADRAASLWGFGIGSIALGALLLKRSRGVALIAWACGLAILLAAWRHEARLDRIDSFPLAETLRAGGQTAVAGEGWIDGTIEAGERSVLTTVRITKIEIGGRSFDCDQRMPAWIQKAAKDLAYGSRVRFSGRLLPHEGPVVPGGFDAREFYYRSLGSLGKLEVRDGDRFELLSGRSGSILIGAVRGVRTWMESSLLLGVPSDLEPYARLVASMALGAREQSPEDLEEFFRTSGTMHLFAVSGLNVAIVAGILLAVFRILRVSKARAVPVILLLLGLYAVLTGLSPSAVRAALMASVMLAGYSLREQGRLLNSLGFAALLLFAWDPQQLFLPGFQLTFVVLFFIACFAKRWSEAISAPLVSDPFLPRSLIRPVRRVADKAAHGFAVALGVSLASWLGSAGLLSWHFQSVSPVGIVANLLMVPFASWIIGFAAFSLSASGLQLGFLAAWTNRLNTMLALILTTLAQWFSSLPGATVNTGAPGAKGSIVDDAVLTVMGDRGDAAILLELRTEAGPPRRWMIDAGSERSYASQVLPLMRSRGVNRIDALLLTHGDQGHLGGAVPLMQQFRPALFFESVLENRSPSHPDITATADRLGIRKITLQRGSLIEPGEGLRIRVLHPDPAAPGRLADDRAIVMRLELGAFSLLLTSDSGFDTEKILLESGASLASDVWIRGQAREGVSGLSAFVDAVNPRLVISSHAEFPASEQIPPSLRQHLTARGIPLYEVGAEGPLELRHGESGVELHALAAGGKRLFTLPQK